MSNNLRERLSAKIKLCLQGKNIPKSCQSIVLKLWPSALLHILKSHGDQTPQWNNAIRMYIDLIDSIQPIENVEQFRQLKDNFMSIARSNNNTLLLHHSEANVEPALKALISHYNQQLGSTKESDLSSTAQSNTLEKFAKLPASIKPGIWCELYIDEGTPARRLRLSVININTGSLIFVNRKGIKKLEKDALVFADELKNGLSKVYKHDSLFLRPSTKEDAEFQKIV
jgi:Protein of unknown function (DUF1631)